MFRRSLPFRRTARCVKALFRSQCAAVAYIQYRLISGAPYRLTEEELLFSVYCIQNNIPQDTEHRKAM